MLSLHDPRWSSFEGGYGIPYDASVPLRRLVAEGARDEIWEELWNHLHHQGILGQASYAAVPHLVEFVRRTSRLDWNALALIACIELERPSNPPILAELERDYRTAIDALPAILGTHPDQV